MWPSRHSPFPIPAFRISLSSLTLILRSLAYHLRINAAVALGVAAATAVLTGALLVGDSVRGSLRQLALDRLGAIDAVMVTPSFFRSELADELRPRVAQCFDTVFPSVLMQGTFDRPAQGGTTKQTARAANVTVLGTGETFWQQGNVRPAKLPTTNEVILNKPLADELGAAVGDRVILRLPAIHDIPADTPLGRKTETSQSRSLTVVDIIPAESLGRFGLRPNQQAPLNAYTNVETLGNLLDQPDKANAIFVAADTSRQGPARGDCIDKLNAELDPRLVDLGIKLERNELGYFNFATDRMLFEPAAADAIFRVLEKHQPQKVLIYLANYITAQDGRGKIPYSTIAAMDFQNESPLGPLELADGRELTQISDGEIVLNQWAADDLKAQGVELKPGDEITLEYFAPDDTHARIGDDKRTTLKLAGVAPIEGVAADRNLTPELRGVTDQRSIANWDPPFPYDPSRVRSVKPNDQDEQYWDSYKATPKGFVSYATGLKLWNSRFGNITSIRVPATPDLTAERLETEVLDQMPLSSLGFSFQDVKEQSLQAAPGTTSFQWLFLGFSFFIIAAAVMLIALLFKLGMDQRASEIGTLLATGISTARTRWLLVAEGLVVAAIGAAIGAAAGIGYAWLMVTGLNTWWREAIVTPFLDLYVTWPSLVIGYVAGLLIAVATIAWALRQMRRASVRRLLAGQSTEERFVAARQRRFAPIVSMVSLAIAAALVLMATRLAGETQAFAFFGSGALVLVGLLAAVWHSLRRERTGGAIVARGGSQAALARLAVRNGARSPLRSTLTIGLVAAATFLIVAISAFRLDPPESIEEPTGGAGGFPLLATSDQPIYQDLRTPEGRSDAGFDDADNAKLAGATVVPLRVQSGDDASCLNLYQATQPRVLGVPDELIDRGGFAWSATAAETDEERANPWLLLQRTVGAEEERIVPVVLDQNTATYSLHLSGIGDRFTIKNSRGRNVPLQVVGLLKNSIFQGDLLIRESTFTELFPGVSGHRMFLLARGESKATIDDLERSFETAIGDYGLDVERTRDRLEAFMSVQNTYLSTFQSLGALGLLLGTFGLATVQLRNVLERRGELALMRATGFRRRRLAEMVMLENAALLCFGLGTGIVAALVAILPNLLRGTASIPWLSLAGTLAIVLAVGLLAGLAAVRATLHAPILGALRGE
jgi:ABC-type antimicrobial peptide transport system permease subunit